MRSDFDAAVAWQLEQELGCPGCGGPRDVWWVYGDQSDPEVAGRYAELEERARDEYGHRQCVRCKVRDSEEGKQREVRSDYPQRFYGLHPVFEPSSDRDG